MDWYERLRSTIVSTIVRDTPKGFWEEIRDRGRQTYLDTFHHVRTDPYMVVNQRIDSLYQVRHFRMEHLLATVAQQHGLACTPTLPSENKRHYVYVTKGAIGLTQAYVPAIGAMPKPARFRERHAKLTDIPKSPRFDLGDEPAEAIQEIR